jgi:hypothetical protein
MSAFSSPMRRKDFPVLRVWLRALTFAAIWMLVAQVPASPAMAQAPALSAGQTEAVEAALTNAINSANAQTCPPEAAKQDALAAAAIANVVVQEIATLGGQHAGEITSIAIALLQEKCVSDATIALALGQAASIVAVTDLQAAIAIGQTVANEGTSGMAQAFASAAAHYQAPQAVADAAMAAPAAATTGGAISGTVTGTSNPVGGGGAPPCANPSCT